MLEHQREPESHQQLLAIRSDVLLYLTSFQWQLSLSFLKVEYHGRRALPTKPSLRWFGTTSQSLPQKAKPSTQTSPSTADSAGFLTALEQHAKDHPIDLRKAQIVRYTFCYPRLRIKQFVQDCDVKWQRALCLMDVLLHLAQRQI